jgi:plasmid stabilization system protein ParE
MAYRIDLSPTAFDDVDGIVSYIANDSPENANRWRHQLFDKISHLVLMPHAYALAPENAFCSHEVRQFLFGRYRILFTICDEDQHVYVLTVRHGARRFLTGDEIAEIE